VPSLGVED
jgi:hypothetical protein